MDIRYFFRADGYKEAEQTPIFETQEEGRGATRASYALGGRCQERAPCWQSVSPAPRSKMGASAVRDWPYAAKCESHWTKPMATRALRNAILAGNVSNDWRGGFPRYVWHVEGELVYEAVLSNQDQGHYHAYPLESRHEWPSGLKRHDRF